MESNTANQLSIKIRKLILAILLVNACGLGLRYFNLSTYIIILGFRFHISFVLPFIIVFNSGLLSYLKKSFLKPEFKGIFLPLILILLPILIELGGLYFLQKIDIGDPEYFYEFGISSIADYPIYLIWNIPQIIILFLFLSSVSSVSRFRFVTVAFVIILLFAFELVTMPKWGMLYWEGGILIVSAIIFSIIINYFRNIYWFVLTVFTLFWLVILAFGSSSKVMINLLFASQYSTWEGFFDISSPYTPFTIPIYFGIVLITTIMGYFIKRKSA